MTRLFAAVIAAAAWLGLAADLSAVQRFADSWAWGAWLLLRYFTTTTNLVVAGYFTVLACCGTRIMKPRLAGAVTLWILLVGVVYHVLLAGLRAPSSWFANAMLHQLTPALTTLFWLLCVPKGGLTRRDPWIWTLYPFAYLGYALWRASLDGRYAYPFINVEALGWQRVGLYSLGILVGFLLASEVMLAIDRRWARAQR